MKKVLKKSAVIVVIALIVYTSLNSLFVYAIEPPVRKWKVEVLDRSEYKWAKFRAVKPQQITELTEYMFSKKELSDNQSYYYDQDCNNSINIADLIVLKSRCLDEIQQYRARPVYDSAVEIVENKLTKNIEFDDYEISNYDFDNSGEINQRDLNMLKDCQKTQIPENELMFAFGGNSLLEGIDIAREFDHNCKELEFVNTDIRQTKIEGNFCICDTDIVFCVSQDGENYNIGKVLGESEYQIIKPLERSSLWYAKIN